MLEVSSVTKQYGKTTALDAVTLTARPGEVTVLLGPNGAGKSTLMKSIIGVLRYTGTIMINEQLNKSTEARRLFGYVPETPALYDLLTADEHLEFIARAYGIKNYEGRMAELLQRFDLEEHRDKPAREMSKGMLQKVSICCALLPQPSFVLFDEPMIGLDPAAIRELKQVLLELSHQGAAVLISTHIIDSIREIWDRCYILHRGRVEEALSKTDSVGTGTDLETLFFQVTGMSGDPV